MIREYAKSCEKSMLVSTIFVLLLGIVLAIEPTGSIRMLTFIIAIMFLGVGIFQIVSYLRSPKEERMTSFSFIIGIILAAVGLFLILNVDSLVKFITVLIGVTISIKSLFKIQFALNLKGISDKWKYNLVFGLVGLSLGILMLLNPFSSAILFLRIMGIVFIVGSIAELIEIIAVLRNLNEDIKTIIDEDKH